MISHNEVPSPEEAERTANPPPATHTAQEDHDGPNSDVRYPCAIIIIKLFTITCHMYTCIFYGLSLHYSTIEV